MLQEKPSVINPRIFAKLLRRPTFFAQLTMRRFNAPFLRPAVTIASFIFSHTRGTPKKYVGRTSARVVFNEPCRQRREFTTNYGSFVHLLLPAQDVSHQNWKFRLLNVLPTTKLRTTVKTKGRRKRRKNERRTKTDREYNVWGEMSCGQNVQRPKRLNTFTTVLVFVADFYLWLFRPREYGLCDQIRQRCANR